MTRYDPVAVEEQIMTFWDKNSILKKANEQNKGKKPFYFLDGPPYTSGKIHLGTAWNKSIKDLVVRYKRMQGFSVWDRAGYDMHGLPTEGKVQAKLGMKTKEDIEQYGLEKFIKQCREFAVTNMLQMNKDFKRLGVWLDFDDAYQTIANDYIEGTWWLVKKAHEKKRLYEGEMTMTWCGSCQTALAKHELEYKEVKDPSIYVKFPVRNKEREYLIIWTTTPWTIPFNLGVMTNPNENYVKARVGEETYILAADLAEQALSQLNATYKITETFRGKELQGTAYIHPFEKELKHHFDALRKKSKKVHTVVLSSEYVTLDQGTGLVHMAPGCGPEDFEVGHREGIPPFNQLDETGVFDKTMGLFSGLHAKKQTAAFIDALEKGGFILSKGSIQHDYAHCWRCKKPIMYRTTTQWFFKVEDLIPKMRSLNKKKIYWVPEWAGSNQFDSWLKNLRDNGITRQRFWGSPLPVWRCGKCQDYAVIESREELSTYGANKIPEDLHKPWIDDVSLPCRKCKGTMQRIPDIMDVWIDAGVASWASLGFPQNKELFQIMFPADFITEGKDQIRGWFNLLYVASILALDNISFKACYMTGFVNDSQGRKMSKSLGNVISPYEVIDKYGADAFRYYSTGGANPGLDLNYNFDDIVIKRRNLEILWNLQNLIIDLSITIRKNPVEHAKDILVHLSIEDRYMLSRLHKGIKQVTWLLENFRINEVPQAIENIFLELSRTYIQFVREKIATGSEDEKALILFVSFNTLFEVIKMFSIVAPFISEKIFQNLKAEFGLPKESIHLYAWPEPEDKWIDEKLDTELAKAKGIIQSLLSLRDKAKIGTRWPLQEAVLVSQDKSLLKTIARMEPLIRAQTNIKEIKAAEDFAVKVQYKINYGQVGPDFESLAPKIIEVLKKETDASLQDTLVEQGSYSLKVDGKKIVLTEKHFIRTASPPDQYLHDYLESLDIYLCIKQNDDLLAEGFSREVIRRLQLFRKKAGLEKRDIINLDLVCSEGLASYLAKYKDMIREWVGIKKITVNANKTPTHAFQYEVRVKDENLLASFSVVK